MDRRSFLTAIGLGPVAAYFGVPPVIAKPLPRANLNGLPISNLLPPTPDAYAVTKRYVEESVLWGDELNKGAVELLDDMLSIGPAND